VKTVYFWPGELFKWEGECTVYATININPALSKFMSIYGEELSFSGEGYISIGGV